MTQLLISVKNVEEALVARYADVDVIDLKDPSVGALGALDVDIVSQIVKAIDGEAFISATVGEGHTAIETLARDIALYASLGVDVVKIAVSELFYQPAFFSEVMRLTSQGVKIVVVFFADQALDFELLSHLEKSGCYGAMLDTQSKKASLFEAQPVEVLSSFVKVCAEHQLVSGLAGSLNKHHIEVLQGLEPSFIGMRGGVCKQYDRTSELMDEEIAEIKTVLLSCNTVS